MDIHETQLQASLHNFDKEDLPGLPSWVAFKICTASVQHKRPLQKVDEVAVASYQSRGGPVRTYPLFVTT